MRVTARSPRFGPVDSVGSPMAPPRVLATDRGQPRSHRFDPDPTRSGDALDGSILFSSYLADSTTLDRGPIINDYRYLAGKCPITCIMLTFWLKPLFLQSNQSVSYDLVATLTRSFRLGQDDRNKTILHTATPRHPDTHYRPSESLQSQGKS